MLYFTEPAGKIAFEKFVKKFLGLPVNEAVVAEALQSLEAFFDIAESLLQQRSYMAGNDFSLADINYMPGMQKLFALGYGDIIARRRAVNAWWERCMDRPAIKRLVVADREAMIAATA